MNSHFMEKVEELQAEFSRHMQISGIRSPRCESSSSTSSALELEAEALMAAAAAATLAAGHPAVERQSTSSTRHLLGSTKSPLTVSAVSAVANVFDESAPPEWASGCPIRLAGVRGERISFQLGIQPNGALRSLEFSVTCTRFEEKDLVEPVPSLDRRFLPPEAVSLRRVMPPDALMPCPWGARISAGEPGRVGMWVSIDIPDGQHQAVYSGTLTVAGHVSAITASAAAAKLQKVSAAAEESAAQMTEAAHLKDSLLTASEAVKHVTSLLKLGSRLLVPESMSVLIEVYDISLPRTPSLPILCGIEEHIIESRWQVERNSEDWRRQLCRHSRYLQKYRMVPFFWRGGARDIEQGLVAYSCPFPIGTPEATEFLSNASLALYVMPMPRSDDDASDDATMPSISALKSIMKEGHAKKAVFHLIDEPTHASEYEKLKAWADDLRKHVPGARIMTTFSRGPKVGDSMQNAWQSLMTLPACIKDSTDIWCAQAWAAGDNEDCLKGLKAILEPETSSASSELWSYVCKGPFSPHPNWHLDMSGGQHRAVAWRAWMEGFTGMVYWSANSYKSDKSSPKDPIKFREGHPAGDGVLIYPGERYGAGKDPLASVRLERALLGLQDIELLDMHSAIFGRRSTMNIMTDYAYKGPQEFTQDWSQAERMRSLIAMEIMGKL